MFVPSTSARMEFDSLQAVHDRLAGTYVFYRDNFYPVLDITKNGESFDLHLMGIGPIGVNNMELHYQGFNIGFVNTAKGPYFISRGGFRQYKQGLSDQNLIVRPLLPASQPLHVAQLKASPEFRKGVAEAVMNLYPQYRDLIERNKSGAFSKYFARFKDELYYKTTKVGSIVDGVATLSVGYEYLKEALEEAIRGT